MDSDHPALDHGDVVLPYHRSFPRRALGLRGAGMGWLLGMGPGGECLAHALAYRHGVSAFRHDAGKARYVESVEHVVDLRDVSALDPWHFPDAERNHQFGARFRAILDRH